MLSRLSPTKAHGRDVYKRQAVVTLLPFTPLAAALGLCALPPLYFAYLALIVLGYMVLVTLMKKLYIRKYHELL